MFTRPPLFIFAIVALVGCATTGTLHPEATRHNDEGAQLLAEGKLDDAEARFRLALEYNPKFSEPRANLGVVAMERDDLAAAEKHLKGAIRLNEDFSEAWSNLGVVYERQGKPKKAREAYERALSIQPGLHDPRRNLAILLIADDDFVSARAHLMRLVQMLPDEVLAQSLLAYCDARLERLDDAQRRATKVLETSPDEPIPHVVLGIVSSFHEDWAAAEAHLARAVDDPLVGHAAETRLAGVYAARGDTNKAWAIVKRLLAADPGDPAANLVAAWLRAEAGLWRESRQHALKALERRPGLKAAKEVLALVCERGGAC